MSDTAKPVGPTIGVAGAATLYTVPGSTVGILRHMHITNTTGGALTFKLSIGADAAGTRLFSDTSIPANGALDWSGFLPIAAAGTLQWNASAGLTFTGGVVEVS